MKFAKCAALQTMQCLVQSTWRRLPNTVRQYSRLLVVKMFRVLQRLGIVLLVVTILVEESCWQLLTSLSAWLSKYRWVLRTEQFIQRQNRYITLLFFTVPVLLALPFKVYAVYLLANGQVLFGLTVLFSAKIFGTIVLTKLLMLSRDKLMTFKILVVGYTTLQRLLQWAHASVQALSLYQSAKRALDKLRVRITACRQWLQSARRLWKSRRLGVVHRAARHLLRQYRKPAPTAAHTDSAPVK